MTRDVIVSIKGLQMMGPENEDMVEVICAGVYQEQDGCQIIQYEEADEENQEINNVTLVIGEGHVELRKTGATKVHMIFEEKQKTTSTYHTRFGDLLMGLDTTRIVKYEEEDGIGLKLHYGLEINYNFVADCNILIKVISAKP